MMPGRRAGVPMGVLAENKDESFKKFLGGKGKFPFEPLGSFTFLDEIKGKNVAVQRDFTRKVPGSGPKW